MCGIRKTAGFFENCYFEVHHISALRVLKFLVSFNLKDATNKKFTKIVEFQFSSSYPYLHIGHLNYLDY